LIKSDKSSTYFLSDIAYHEDKVNRGFDRIINIWGADHHSHVSRLKASMKSLGNSQTHFDFLMIQFVRLLKDGKDISMSKRSGQYTTIKDLLSLVNKDVVRFMMVTRSSDTHFDFDLNQCLQDSDENPVFYIQYANARINSIIKKSGVSELDINKMDIIESDKEIKLIKEIIGFEDAIKDSAQSLSPHKLTFYLQNLAKEFHSYYKSTKILNENQDQVMSRLVLITTIKFILSNGLQLLGASSPEEM
jgi:arginyl-tRNA synthetase